MSVLRRCVAAGAAALLALGLAACGIGADDVSSADRKRIAFLLPDVQATRYDRFDVPFFAGKVEELCPECELIYRNAAQLSKTQEFQAEEALENGADVLVLDPVDGTTAGAIVEKAKKAGVPVISYDRLVEKADIDYYISFDNEKVGQLQATSLVGRLKQTGTTAGRIVMINGSETDNNAKLFNKGARSVFDKSGFELVPEPEFFTPDWEPARAQEFMTEQIGKLAPARDDNGDAPTNPGFVGVYAANDGTAGGAIAAMTDAGVEPMPPVTGQDAELPAIQRILTGQQYMTVYKALQPEAERAAEFAVALVKGQQPKAPDQVNNGLKDVPSLLLEPTIVTRENLKEAVVDSGLYTADELCQGPTAGACGAAGLS